MQSTIVNPAATSVDERLTMILIAREQSQALHRALAYHADMQGAIVVVDAAAQATHLTRPTGTLVYAHSPHLTGASLATLTAEGLKQVKTPFVVVADVDSFMLVNALSDAWQFLEAHSQYVACQGYSLGYCAGVDYVDYQRRDYKVDEDFAEDDAAERVIGFMAQGFTLLNAVTRTELLQRWLTVAKPDLGEHWEDIGRLHYLLALGKVRILPVPYALHAAEGDRDALRDHAIRNALHYVDLKSRTERENFARHLSEQLQGTVGELSPEQVLEGFAALGESLNSRHYLARDRLLRSKWNVSAQAPEPLFEPKQFVELPFYNPEFFSLLEHIEFLIHLMPCGDEQLQQLEAALLKQAELSRAQSNPDAEPLVSRLWQAYATYSFNAAIVDGLLGELEDDEQAGEEVDDLTVWRDRLKAYGARDNGELLYGMESGQLLRWLDACRPAPDELKALTAKLAGKPAGSEISVVLLDLDNDLFKLQTTFDSLINGYCRTFKVIILTSGEPPAATTLQNTLHFVKVTESNYIDKLNQVIRQSTSDWLVLAEAGDVFTASGLLKASAELADAAGCRAVAMDEIHRKTDGTLAHVLRPDFNLDMLQAVPALMARHWLVRRKAVVEAGGYSRDFADALELDLLLRLIEAGGMNGLAHLSEPLLICPAPRFEVNETEHKALARHLRNRGYQAEVSSLLPGTFKIDYRHTQRPMVSILIQAQDNLPELQRCLQNVLQRTRYPRYEILIGDNGSAAPEVSTWLAQQEQSSSRIRVLRAEQPIAASAMLNALGANAAGEYLIVLDAESQVVNVGWIEAMLNQALRPEVGVVGVKLIDNEGTLTLAGLILGFNGGVGSAFVGASKDALGYMNRLVVEQSCSAVSAACLMIEKALFEALEGFDEGEFSAALADVDLCLKAAQAGFLTVWTPQVLVVHPGALSDAPQALQALRDKWPEAFDHDTAYNRHLSLQGFGYSLS